MEGCGDLCVDDKSNDSTVYCEMDGAGLSLQLSIWKKEAVLKCADTEFVTLGITRKEEFFNATIYNDRLAWNLSMYCSLVDLCFIPKPHRALLSM